MSSSTMIADGLSTPSGWASHLRTGCVTGVCTDDPLVFAEEAVGLELTSRQASGQFTAHRIITCSVRNEVDHRGILRLLVDQLAHGALLLWPDWYGGIASLSGKSEDNADESVLQDINEFRVHNAALRIDHLWFRDAVRLCLAGQLPVPKNHSLTTQVRQLSSCLRGDDLCVVVAVTEKTCPPAALLSLARASEWLAKEAEAKVLLVVPLGTESSPALSAIPFFRGVDFGRVEQPASIAAGGPDRRFADQVVSESPLQTFASGPCEQKHLVQPILGRPHPASPGEQALAKILAGDSELSGLFQFNLPVRTIRGTRYLVDLIWSECNVVVEVDGFRHHSSRESFASDRCRDFELLISDFVVLRLPHDDVVSDPVLAVEKIRDVVRWRRTHRNDFNAE